MPLARVTAEVEEGTTRKLTYTVEVQDPTDTDAVHDAAWAAFRTNPEGVSVIDVEREDYVEDTFKVTDSETLTESKPASPLF